MPPYLSSLIPAFFSVLHRCPHRTFAEILREATTLMTCRIWQSGNLLLLVLMFDMSACLDTSYGSRMRAAGRHHHHATLRSCFRRMRRRRPEEKATGDEMLPILSGAYNLDRLHHFKKKRIRWVRYVDCAELAPINRPNSRSCKAEARGGSVYLNPVVEANHGYGPPEHRTMAYGEY